MSSRAWVVTLSLGVQRIFSQAYSKRSKLTFDFQSQLYFKKKVKHIYLVYICQNFKSGVSLNVIFFHTLLNMCVSFMFQKYRLATKMYMSQGRDGYDVLKECEELVSIYHGLFIYNNYFVTRIMSFSLAKYNFENSYIHFLKYFFKYVLVFSKIP